MTSTNQPNIHTLIGELQAKRQRAVEHIQNSAHHLRQARFRLMDAEAAHKDNVWRFERLDRELAELDGRLRQVRPKKARRSQARKTTNSHTACMQEAVEKLLVGLTDEQRESVLATFNART